MQRNDEGIVNKVFSETGDAASPAFYDQGFTPAMSTPGSGVFPPRTAFNYLFKILTALAVDVNSSGCMLPWDVLVNYSQGARVVGTDNKVYVATTNTGPANGNAANPAQDPVPSEWQLAPEYSFGTMAQQNANDVTITGGNIIDCNIGACQIDNSVIGGNTPAAAVFTKAVDNGVAPTLPAQLTNKAYVDPAVTNNGNGTCYQLPGGLKLQIMQVTFPNTGSQGTTLVVNFPVPFTNSNYFLDGTANESVNTSGIDSGIFRMDNSNKTLDHVLCKLDTNQGVSVNKTVSVSIFAFGV